MLSRREAIAFAVLFAAYQAPEGIGARWLHSFPAQAALLLLFFPIAFTVGRWLRASRGSAYALERSAARPAQFGAMLALAIAAKALAVWVGAAIGVYAIEGAPVSVDAAFAGAIASGLAMTFFPSIAEDIVTRGFWFRLERVRWTPWRFVLASSAIYAGNHIFRLALGPLEWLMLFAFGCAYAAALVRSGSLWPAVGLHWGWNFANAVQDRVVSVTVLSPDGGRLVSAAAHLVMLAIVWVWLPRRSAQVP